jgi:hypothetical protein
VAVPRVAEDVAEATSPRAKVFPPAFRGSASPRFQVNRGNTVLAPPVDPSSFCPLGDHYIAELLRERDRLLGILRKTDQGD